MLLNILQKISMEQFYKDYEREEFPTEPGIWSMMH